MLLRSSVVCSVLVFGPLVLASACATKSAQIPDETTDGGDDAASTPENDASVPKVDAGGDAVSAVDASVKTWCGELGKKQDTCDGKRECGGSFDTWCAAQSKTNSKAFEDADVVCLGSSGCDSNARTNCRYKAYAPASLTAAQKALAAAKAEKQLEKQKIPRPSR